MEHNNNSNNCINNNHRILKCWPASCSAKEIHQILSIVKYNHPSRMLPNSLKLLTLRKLIVYLAVTHNSSNSIAKLLIMPTINLLVLALVRLLRSQGVVAITSLDSAVQPKQVTLNNNNNNINRSLTRIIYCSIYNTMLRNHSHCLRCRHSNNK